MPSKFVVHCKKWPYDAYIDRPSLSIRRDIPGSDGRWGNPFVVGKDVLERKLSLSIRHGYFQIQNSRYQDFPFSNKELMNKIHELKGKVLGLPW